MYIFANELTKNTGILEFTALDSSSWNTHRFLSISFNTVDIKLLDYVKNMIFLKNSVYNLGIYDIINLIFNQ